MDDPFQETHIHYKKLKEILWPEDCIIKVQKLKQYESSTRETNMSTNETDPLVLEHSIDDILIIVLD